MSSHAPAPHVADRKQGADPHPAPVKPASDVKSVAAPGGQPAKVAQAGASTVASVTLVQKSVPVAAPVAAPKPSGPKIAARSAHGAGKTRGVGDAETAEAAAPEAAAAEEEPVQPREGLCQVELVPFALVSLHIYRDAKYMIACVNDKDYFRSDDYSVSGDVLDTVTRVALEQPSGDQKEVQLHVHFGDRFESMVAWTPTPAEVPQWQLDKNACPKVNGLLQGRFPNTSVEESEL
jgi:hypothetical protein